MLLVPLTGPLALVLCRSQVCSELYAAWSWGGVRWGWQVVPVC
jgi:hypothetical protein